MASHEIDLSHVQWLKSTYSNGTGGECVEVAAGIPGIVPVRDSKQGQDGPVLPFRPSVWSAFLTAVKG
jgi:hypothetical protein